MSIYLMSFGVAAASILTLIFSSLTYSLREFSRQGLAEYLGKHNGDKWFESITDNTGELIFLTAILRQFANILMWAMVFGAFELSGSANAVRWSLTILLVALIAVFCSVAIPHAAARYAASEIVGACAPLLHVLRVICMPLTALMHAMDGVVKGALGVKEENGPQQIEEEILSAVEEGESQGVVDEQEREMIESVIEFRDTTAGHIMTTRRDIIALPVDTTLEQVKKTIGESGLSRIPIYDGTLDRVIGILYARDLMKYLAIPDAKLDVRATMRPSMVVPETQPLKDLLTDFRLQKVHIAVVQDEYGSTAGIVTVEDIIEELVGEISDEHEPSEPAMLKRIDERTAEADARVRIDELNRLMGLSLPEDAGYETLGGFVTAQLSRIAEKGTVFDFDGAKFTVIDAEPQRVKRVKIEVIGEPARASN